MRLVIIIVMVVYIKNSVQRVQFYREETPSSIRAQFIEKALLSYYEETRNIIVFAKKSSILQRFSPMVPLLLISELNVLMKAMSEKPGTLIVILDGFAESEGLHDLKELQSVRTKHPVMVVCDTTATCSSEVYLENIATATDSPLLHYLVVDGKGLIQLFQRTKTVYRHCGISRLVRIAFNSSDAWPNAETFFMAVNFNKCPARLAVRPTPWHVEPCKPDDSNFLCGYEGTIIKYLINKINATPITIAVNSTLEIENLVAAERADLGYGYLYNTNNQAFTYSRWYLFVKLAMSVPATASGFGGSLLKIALPFESEVWIGLAVSMVIMLTVGKLVPHFRKIRPLQQFSLIIGVSVPTQPRRLCRRIYYISIVLFGFWLSQLYLVNLTKIYSSSRPYEITTLEEVEKLGLRVYGREEGRELLIEAGYPGIAQNYKVLNVEEITAKVVQIQNGKSSDIAYTEIDPDSRASWQGINDIDQAVRWHSSAIVMPNSSTLVKALNRIIVAKLESKIMTRLDNGLPGQVDTSSKGIPGPKRLGLRDLQGVFGILAGGFPLSISIFIIELVLYFSTRKLVPIRRSRV